LPQQGQRPGGHELHIVGVGSDGKNGLCHSVTPEFFSMGSKNQNPSYTELRPM
jgi:hypothetical protein